MAQYFPPAKVRYWAKVKKGRDCWLWQGNPSEDYGTIRVNGVKVGVHRFTWELYYGPIPKGMWVLHHCDTPKCVRPDHLWLGTQADNDKDRDQKGRNVNPVGSQHGRAKLTEKIVREARLLHIKNRLRYNNSALARKYGVSRATIRCAIDGTNWRHI